MKKLSLLFALALFFVCGTALNASASAILEVTQQEYASFEVSNEIEFQHSSISSLVSAIPTSDAAELVQCTLVVEISCGGIGIIVEATGNTCAEAGAAIDDFADKVECVS
ncbi:hypothetical protein SAMN05660226_03978 [Parapedobacter luteus]|uniref:Uncharacterized protein n=1 Tax=Parapedobacter luteus TaxID=623280 RepID=A0A1T5FFV7_9SPHI|nr:hypothetical protein [Parapedobacter luteus]SKB94958.1 hypothetical protein SAMN05660226_03978 [Parapedobacter luteus]